MKHEITYRVLGRHDIQRLQEIDRTELIERVWKQEGDDLILQDVQWQVPEWSSSEKAERIADLEEVFDNGAAFYGAFNGERLVGMGVQDHNFLDGDVRRLNLEGLWISGGYRGCGIGKTLFELCAQKARDLGAERMYVSATCSENTVRFYRRRGCVPADPIDKRLFEMEPEDIHLELSL